jgi:hypothetical protein
MVKSGGLFTFTFDKMVGKGDHDVIFEAMFDVDPGEPAVLRYPDGSGYPGSPPSVSLCEVRSCCFNGIGRTDANDGWFRILDDILSDLIGRDALCSNEEVLGLVANTETCDDEPDDRDPRDEDPAYESHHWS